jgi:uncharacterized protein
MSAVIYNSREGIKLPLFPLNSDKSRLMKSSFPLIASLMLIFPLKGLTQNQTYLVEDKTHKIEVTGSAEMDVIPDEIYLGITLQEYLNKDKVKIDIDQIQKDFLEKAAKAGISKDRIQIQNMSGFDQSNWYWRKRKKEQPDLMASTTYIIKFSSAAEIDKLVNSVDDRATQNMYIQKTSSSKIEDYRKEVKIKALQAAKAKAEYLCQSIGEKIGKAIFIQEVDNTIMPYYRNAMSNMAMDAASNQSANEGIEFQKITVRFEMRVQFELN